jgi:ComF family protein
MLNFLKELFFPRFCLHCNKYGCYICQSCKKLLTPSPSLCLYCEKSSLTGETHPTCTQPFGIDGHISIFSYTPVLKKILAGIKYKLVQDAFPELFLTIEDSLRTKLSLLSEKYYIQPIPLHPDRLRQRGFNQAAVLGKFVATTANFEAVDFLRRTKATQAQAQLSKAERLKNAQDAFSLKKDIHIANINILLIDDVVTTGSTVKEAARALKSGGAAKIWVFSVAKG